MSQCYISFIFYYFSVFFFTCNKEQEDYIEIIKVHDFDNLNIVLRDPFGSQCPPDTLTRYTAKGLLHTNFVYKIVCHHIMMTAFTNMKIQIKN